MGFLSLIPPAPLSPFVASIWSWDTTAPEQGLERILPKPGAGLIFNLHEDETRSYHGERFNVCQRRSGSVLVGPATRCSVIDTHEQIAVVGVEFHAAGAAAFFDGGIDMLRNCDVDLDGIVPAAQRGLRERLLDAPNPSHRLAIVQTWLSQRLRVPSLHAVVAWATRQLDCTPTVGRIDALVARSGYSARRFNDVFNAHVGIGPKRYARLQRFRAALAHAHARTTVDWSALALAGGYHDQSHLVHEFREFSGMTPGAWTARRGETLNHVAVDVADASDCRNLQDAFAATR